MPQVSTHFGWRVIKKFTQALLYPIKEHFFSVAIMTKVAIHSSPLLFLLLKNLTDWMVGRILCEQHKSCAAVTV